MCSLAESDLTFVNDDTDSQSECSVDFSTTSTLCKKCRTEESVLTLRTKDRYCRSCFTIAATHKFRSTLGKNRVMRHGERVCVNFDARQQSIALVKLIDSSLDEKNVKRVVYTPILLIVLDPASRLHANEILAIAKRFEYPVFAIHLESGLCPDSCTVFELTDQDRFHNLKPSMTEEFQNLLNSFKDLSARDAFTDSIRKKVLITAAEQLNCKKVFIPDISNDLAVKIIAGISAGRGGHLTSDVGFQDVTSNGVQILRPLKDFSDEEVREFNHGVDYCWLDKGVEKLDNVEDSIVSLTKKFVDGLQTGFPATIPTICRTGDKLSRTDNEKESSAENCDLCGCVMDTKVVNGCSALDATRLSRMLSSRKPEDSLEELLAENLGTLSIEPYGPEGGSCSTSGDCSSSGCGSTEEGVCCQSQDSTVISKDTVKAFLCYSCQIVLDKMPTIPGFLKRSVRTRLNRQLMKEEIKEFLLE